MRGSTWATGGYPCRAERWMGQRKGEQRAMGREEGCSSVLRLCVHRRSMCIKSGGACASLSPVC
jgi:hypothetical protein